MDALVCTWQNKVTVDDTFHFGGDLKATGSSPGTWSSGAFSIERAGGDLVDYIELDFTFDAALTLGHGVAVGLCAQDPGQSAVNASWDSAWVWNTDGTLEAYDGGGKVYDSTSVIGLPMSARIIYNAGVLTWRSNAGSDTLRATSARTVAALNAIMRRGLQVKAAFLGTSGAFHATLKATTTAPVSIGAVTPYVKTTFENLSSFAVRTPMAAGFPPPNPNPRPTEGKLWPRNK